MSEPMSVKVSSRCQIALPSQARKMLGIRPGDRLLVDIQDGVLILIPEPGDYVAALGGLDKGIWAGVDTAGYLREERGGWDRSGKS